MKAKHGNRNNEMYSYNETVATVYIKATHIQEWPTCFVRKIMCERCFIGSHLHSSNHFIFLNRLLHNHFTGVL